MEEIFEIRSCVEIMANPINWTGLSSVLHPANTVYFIWETVFTGQKTQPTVSK